MSNNSNITHKELLTFSNLTNLEWEYVQLELDSNDESEMQIDTVEPRYHKLNDLLDPKLFVREDEEGNFERYVYMKDAEERDEINQQDKEEGFKEMRRQAGIAMEYQEKLDKNEEADFLKDWEVIYGGDNYKVAADYINSKFSDICKGLNQINENANLRGQIVSLEEKLDMKDTGFRVVVFKKKAETNEEKDQIVIAYKGKKEDDKNGFPPELEWMVFQWFI